jgi:hemerythrin-like metal-binding protein
MHKPKWLYEALPWIYAVSGVLVMLSLRNWMAVVSGGTLVLTGALVWAMRKRFRRETLEIVNLDTLNLPARLAWKPALDVGHEVLDRQHRQMFTLCNELIQVVGVRKPDSVVQALLRELMAEIRNHFVTEERVAEELGTPLSAEHRRHHAALLARAEQLRERCRGSQADIGDLVRTLVVDVVAGHVLAEAAGLSASVARAQREETASA